MYYLFNAPQRSSIRAVADFKAVVCARPQWFAKGIKHEFTTSPAIAFIQCWLLAFYNLGHTVVSEFCLYSIALILPSSFLMNFK